MKKKKFKNNFQLFVLLAPYLKSHKLKILASIVLFPIASASFAAQPYILQRAIDDSLKSFDIEKLYFYVALMAAAVILNFIVQIIQFWLVNKIGQHAIADLRLDLFAHLQRLPMTYFDKTPVGRNISRLTSDLEQLSDSFAGGLILVVFDFLNIIAILCFMFFLNWKLSFAITIFLIPVYILSKHYQALFREANFVARKKISELNSFLQQNIIGIGVVHALNSAQKSMKKFAKSNQEYFDANDTSIKADSQLSALIELISIIALLALIFISSLILKNDFVTIGIVLAFIQYTQSLFEPIRNLSDRFTVIQSAFTAVERVDQLLDEKEEIDKGHLNHVELNEKLFEAKNVNFRYSRPLDLKDEMNTSQVYTDWVLKDLDFVFERGKKYALVGRTGSGKSTIIKLLTRLYELDSGSLSFCDSPINDFTKEALRSNIAVIHQDTYIFEGSLRENIKLNRDEKILDWDLVKPVLALTNLKLDSVLSARATNISSGEAQVINFARALITKPEIIVLDEATAKIDIKTELFLQNFLEDYLQKRTAIIIAHRLETIKNCDEILFLKNGKVIEKGSHQELLSIAGEYYSYHEILSLSS